MRITIHAPDVPPGLSSNLAGLGGLAAVAVAVGALAGDWWWSVLIGGLAAVVLAVLAQLGDGQDAPAAASPAAAPSAGIGGQRAVNVRGKDGPPPPPPAPSTGRERAVNGSVPG